MEPSIKSTLVAGNKAYLVKRFGAHVLVKVAARMDPTEAKMILQDFFTSPWFPEQVHANFMDSVVEVLGNGDLTIGREMGTHTAHSTVPTIYKVFMKVGSPNFVMGKSDTFWRQCHTHGHLEVINKGPKESFLKLIDFPCPSRAFCESLVGFFTGILELCGCKNISVLHPHCRAKGDSICAFPGVWE